MDRWVIGILGVFGAYVVVNAIIIFVSMQDPPQIEPTYQAGER